MHSLGRLHLCIFAVLGAINKSTFSLFFSFLLLTEPERDYQIIFLDSSLLFSFLLYSSVLLCTFLFAYFICTISDGLGWTGLRLRMLVRIGGMGMGVK